MTYFQKVLEEMHIRQFMKRKSISDSRSVESILDKRLRIEVQPTQTNEVERVKRFMNVHLHCIRGRIQGGAIGAIAIAPPKTYESNFIHHNFEQFGKQHSRYQAILPSVFCHSSVVKHAASLLQ